MSIHTHTQTHTRTREHTHKNTRKNRVRERETDPLKTEEFATPARLREKQLLIFREISMCLTRVPLRHTERGESESFPDLRAQVHTNTYIHTHHTPHHARTHTPHTPYMYHRHQATPPPPPHRHKDKHQHTHPHTSTHTRTHTRTHAPQVTNKYTGPDTT